MPAVTLRENTLTAAQWQRALSSARFYGLQQDWGYGAAARDLGAEVSRLAIYDGDTLIGLAQLMHKKWLRLLPSALCMRGPVWVGEVSGETKIAAYRLLRRKHLYGLWMPEDPSDMAALQAARARKVMTSYHTALLDLSLSEQALRAQLDGKWRNRLVAAEHEKLSVKRLAHAHDYQHWLQAEAEQSQSRGYGALSPMLVPLYQMQLGDKAVLALEARAQHTPVAGVICLIHGHSATYHIGHSHARGKALSAHNLLLWRAMLELKARGIRWLDLGGINTDSGAGIARFKLGTGADVKTLAGTYF